MHLAGDVLAEHDHPGRAADQPALERLHQRHDAGTPSFVDHLLAMPQGDVEFERQPVTLREVEF